MDNHMEEDSDIYVQSFRAHKGNSFATLLGLYKGYYKNFILSSVLYLVKHSPIWLLPISTANIINAIIAGDPQINRIISVNVLIIAALLLGNIPINYIYTELNSKAIRSVEAGLRSALIHKIQFISILDQKNIQSGRIQSKIMRDVEAVETVSQQLFVNLVFISINVIIALVITASRSWVVFIFFVLMIPVCILLVTAFKKKIKKSNNSFRLEMEATSGKVMEMLELEPVTRAHALEEQEIEKMDGQVKDIARHGLKLDLLQSNFGAISWTSLQFLQVVCLVFTALLATKGAIPIGDVVLYQTYFTSIITQVTALLTLVPIIAKGLESVNSIGELLLMEGEEDDSQKEVLDDLKGEFEFRNVHYHYPNRTREVAAGIDLKVRPHETIAFVGKSGSGKSTLINLLIGFLKPTEGELLIDGHDIRNLSLHSYRRFLAVIPQETVLFSGSIRENILYGTEGVSEERLQEAVDGAGLRELINRLPDGLDTKVGERGNSRSGGQKQRISIARALVRDPHVIIMDEATSALDAISDAAVTAALEKLGRDRTVFIVAHKLATVRNADRIAVMVNGKIAEIGTYEELMAKKGYYYDMQTAEESAR